MKKKPEKRRRSKEKREAKEEQRKKKEERRRKKGERKKESEERSMASDGRSTSQVLTSWYSTKFNPVEERLEVGKEVQRKISSSRCDNVRIASQRG